MIEIALQHESGTYEKMYEEKADDEKMGISQVMVSKLEKEESNPTIKKLCEMFWDLGLDIKLTISEEDRFNLKQFM